MANNSKITNQEYAALVKQRAGKSPLGRDMAWAFLVGGAICALGQYLLNLYQRLGLDQDRRDGRIGHPHRGGGPAHRPGLVRQAGQAGGGGDPGAHHRLCQRHGLPGPGVQDRGLTYNRHTVGSME